MEWKMPDLGEGVQEGEIIKWLVKEGDKIRIDQHVVELMTDKATMEIPSPIEGVVQKIVKKEGEIAKIGETLAVIGEGELEEVPGSKFQVPGSKFQVPGSRFQVPGSRFQVPGSISKEEHRTSNIEHRTKSLAAPTIRQLARELNVDLETITGTGPSGRITKEDVEKIVQQKSSKFQVPSSKIKSVEHGTWNMERLGQEERIPLRGLRRKIAEHMVLSRKTTAHFTHVDEADFTELVSLREKSKKKAEDQGIKLTYLPFIMKAVVQGLKKYPQINSSLDENTHEIIVKKYYNLGVAVATEEGLMVPVVKNVDQQSLFDLAREIVRLSEEARSHKIALEDLKGGTFTITNIGSIGGVLSAPIINYPEVAIMGLHQIKPTPVIRGGKVEVRQMMYISISADHRVVDGAYVAAFLKEVIGLLESPGEYDSTMVR